MHQAQAQRLLGVDAVDGDTLDQIFDVFVRDLSRHALDLHSKPSSTPAQMEYAKKLLRKPAFDAGRYGRVWATVHALKDAYAMNA